MSDANHQLLVERFLAAYNAFDIDGMMDLVSTDIRFENYSDGILTVSCQGASAFRQLAEGAKSLFSEREQRITVLIDEGDSAQVSIAYRGKLAADIKDGPSAGTVIEMTGRSEYGFTDGKISRLVDYS
jgi:ketosteroid isomerase-like protein